jgi:hypothetical protein
MRWIILAAAAVVTLSGATAGQSRSGPYHSVEYPPSRYHSDKNHSGGYRSEQYHSGNSCAPGELTRIRLSKIKPGGSMAGFRDAVAAHTRWYQSHGFRIQQRIAPVLVSADGKMQASPNEVMTFATSTDVPRDKHDAGWDAFVAQYRANSIVEKETIVCLPA